jgi:hypothetical protein
MDEFTIRVPRERPFAAVPGLVLGGIAARHDLTLEALDDLQLALESLLDRSGGIGDVTIVLQVDGEVVSASVGPVGTLAARELEREADASLGLRRLLDAVVDDVTLSDRDGETWVELRKQVALDGSGAAR